MNALEKRLNSKVPGATAALEIYYNESLAGKPPTDFGLCKTVERVLDWILWYSHTHYPEKCLFDRDLLQRASSDVLSDDDVARAKPTAQKAALEAMDAALRGQPRTKRRATTGLAQHLQSEAESALLLVVKQYGVDPAWRPTTDVPDEDEPETSEGSEGVADYHDNEEDAESRGGSRGGSWGGSLENLQQGDTDPSPAPLSPKEWVLRSRIKDRTLARLFRNLMTTREEDEPQSATEWVQQNQERDAGRRQTLLVQQQAVSIREEAQQRMIAYAADLQRSLGELTVAYQPYLDEWAHASLGLAVEAAFREAAFRRGFWDHVVPESGTASTPNLVVLQGRRDERVAEKLLSDEVELEIWRRRNDGYGSAKRHWEQLRDAGIPMDYETYRQRRTRAIQKVSAELRRQGVTVGRRVFEPEEAARGS